MSDPLGANLIFLVSQPRAGSTMLQRVLGNHPDIHTTSEPWVMLHPCQILKGGGGTAGYEAGGWADLARDEFLKHAGGRETLVQGVREFGRVVYTRALEGSGKTLFLDKTPRYYHVLPELAAVFPAARFVILLRNPMAVLCSIVRTWVQKHPPSPGFRRGHYAWERMPSYRDDLLTAPRLLAAGIAQLGPRVRVVRFEELVADPGRDVAALCAWLGVPFVPTMLTYATANAPDFAFGDPLGIQQHTQPEASHGTGWIDDLRDPALWKLAADYARHLRLDLPDALGYGMTFDATLRAQRPAAWRLLLQRSLEDVVGAESGRT